MALSSEHQEDNWVTHLFWVQLTCIHWEW